jgi:hypothetical protein
VIEGKEIESLAQIFEHTDVVCLETHRGRIALGRDLAGVVIEALHAFAKSAPSGPGQTEERVNMPNESRIIEPGIGRILWYYGNQHDPIHKDESQPLAAWVAKVLSPSLVNLMVVDEHGRSHQRSNVFLSQPGNDRPEAISYCAWMPFQVSQHEKHKND